MKPTSSARLVHRISQALNSLKIFLVNKASKSPYVQYGAFSATYTPETLTKMKNLIPNSKFMVAHNQDDG